MYVCVLSPKGKWLKVKSLEELKERAIFETAGGGYLMAEDSGYFTVGDTREGGKDHHF